MKNPVILFILLFGSTLYGQTDSIEKAILYKKMLSKEIGQAEYSRIGMKWNQTIKKYPELPQDLNGQVHYVFLYEFPGINKEILFTRTIEWLAINYGLIPSYIYSNLSDGKIIFRNSLNLDFANGCTYTSVISIKNEKILMEFINIGFQAFNEGHYSNNVWVPEKTYNFSFSEIYPIILKNYTEWDSYLNLLNNTDIRFKLEKDNLYDYITTFDYSYAF